jgi:hypothetical protein
MFGTPAFRVLAAVALLGCGGVALVGRNTGESVAPSATTVAATKNAPAKSGASASTGGDNPSLVAQILARPVFTPGRRPPEPAARSPVAPIPEPPAQQWEWRLAGIMVSPSKREALFARDDLKVAVSEGEDIDGWTLVAIAADAVQIEGLGVKRTLRPEFDPAAVAAAPAASGKKLALKPPASMPSARQSQVALLAAAKKAMEDEMKRPKRQLRPRGPSP